MSPLPEHLLVHTVTVEPYLSWGVYGPAHTMRCVVDEKMSAWRGQPGVEQITQITVFAQLYEQCPPGSVVTLGDGRKGYAVAALRRDGGGLPTPDHLEVAVNATTETYSPAFGETVVLKRAGEPSRDRYGNTRFRYADVAVGGCAVRMLSSSETSTGVDDRVVTNIEVILPPGTAVTAKDRMEVRGLLYEINGEPTPVDNNMTGGRAGVRVVGLRYGG